MQRAGFKKAASANGSDGAAGAAGSTAKTSPFAASSTASAGDASAARAALYNARERTRETLIAAAAFALVVAFAITTHKIGATLWLALAARIAWRCLVADDALPARRAPRPALKGWTRHAEDVESVRRDYARFLETRNAGDKVALRRSAGGVADSNRTLAPLYKKKAAAVDVSRLAGVIAVDLEKRLLHVEPGAPQDELAAAALARGLVPAVVPEFPGITAGGAFSGGGIESTSAAEGSVADTVESLDVITGDGRFLTGVSRTNHPDLFAAAAAGFGTVGEFFFLQGFLFFFPSKERAFAGPAAHSLFLLSLSLCLFLLSLSLSLSSLSFFLFPLSLSLSPSLSLARAFPFYLKQRHHHPPRPALRARPQVRHRLLPAPRRHALGRRGARAPRPRHELSFEIESLEEVARPARVPRRGRPGPALGRRRRGDARRRAPRLRRRAPAASALVEDGALVLLAARGRRTQLPGPDGGRLRGRVGRARGREGRREPRRVPGRGGRGRHGRRLPAGGAPFGVSRAPPRGVPGQRRVRDAPARGLSVPVRQGRVLDGEARAADVLRPRGVEGREGRPGGRLGGAEGAGAFLLGLAVPEAARAPNGPHGARRPGPADPGQVRVAGDDEAAVPDAAPCRGRFQFF